MSTLIQHPKATVVACVAAVLATSACGKAGTVAPSRTLVPPPTQLPTPSSVAPTRSPARASAADLSCTADEVSPAAEHYLPPGEALQLAKDETFGTAVGTLHRVYTSADGVYAAEVDVLPYANAFLAENDYPNAQGYVSGSLSDAMHSTPAIGNEADEYVGRVTNAADNTGAAAISFREKDVLVIVVWESGNGVVIPDIAEAIASAQDTRIIQRD